MKINQQFLGSAFICEPLGRNGKPYTFTLSLERQFLCGELPTFKAKVCGKELEARSQNPFLWLFSPKTHTSILANLPLIGNVYGKKCGSPSLGLEIIGRT